MKKIITILTITLLSQTVANAQDDYSKKLQQAVAQLDQAAKAKDFEKMAGQFINLAEAKQNDWLPFYYAAYCNAKTGWLYKDEGERIEPYADLADMQIKRAEALLDTTSDKKQLSEVLCVKSMINRARVFINPMTYGRKYGPVASAYIYSARRSNPQNPRALLLAGWEKFATPKMWGGDKQKAKEILLKAKTLKDAEPTNTSDPHWGKKETEELLSQIK